MTEIEALRTFCNNTPTRKWIVSLIQRWDEKISVRANAKNLGIAYQIAYFNARTYGLRYVKESTAKGGANSGRKV